MWKELKTEVSERTNDIVRDVVVPRAIKGLSDEERAKLREDVDLIKRIVASSRDPRIAIVGSDSVPLRNVLVSLLGDELPEPLDVKEKLGHGRWYSYPTDRGDLRLLDARTSRDEDTLLKPLQYDVPDAIIVVTPSGEKDVEKWVDDAISSLEFVEDEHLETPPMLAAIVRLEDDGREIDDFKTQQALKSSFVDAGLPRDFVPVVATARPGKLVQTMLPQVADEVRFPLARLVENEQAKRDLADSLIRMCASANGTIATIPIPVASTVPITSIQVLMIGGIAYISGRELSVKTVGEFVGAMGLNVGAGVAFRELARLLVQLIPVAGSVVSASIAAGATYTLGKSATRYFLR